MKKYFSVLVPLALILGMAISFFPTSTSAQEGEVARTISTCDISTFTLRMGFTGEQVRCLQKLLNEKGFLVSFQGDGSPGNEGTYFGSETEAAVKKFQEANGLIVDGVFGRVSQSKINITDDGWNVDPDKRELACKACGTNRGPWDANYWNCYYYNYYHCKAGTSKNLISDAESVMNAIDLDTVSPPPPVDPDSARTTDKADVCLPGHLFNVATGESCVTESVVRGCLPSYAFSPINGIKCNDKDDREVGLPAGCTSTKGYSVTTGQKCDSSVVMQLPSPASSITVLSPNGGETWVTGTTQTIKWDDNIPCPVGKVCGSSTKKFDIKLEPFYPPCVGNECPAYPYLMPYTIARNVSGNKAPFSYAWNVGKVIGEDAMSSGSYTITICPVMFDSRPECDTSDSYFKIVSANSNTPVISGVSGPQTLRVNQTGTWTVKASDSSKGNLSYSVIWGDEWNDCPLNTPCAVRVSGPQQSATFTHSYSQTGTYTPRFTVTNSAGQSADASLSVEVTSGITPTNTGPKITHLFLNSATGVGLSWNKLDNADKYEVLRNGRVVKTYSATNNSTYHHEDTKLSSDTSYTYEVKALESNGATIGTSEATVRTLNDDMDIKTASSEKGKVTLSWTNPNPQLGIVNFWIKRDDAYIYNAATDKKSSSITSYTDTFLAKGSDTLYAIGYAYRGFDSVNGQSLNVILEKTTVPEAPRGFDGREEKTLIPSSLPSVKITADHESIPYKTRAALRWTSSNVTSCIGDNSPDKQFTSWIYSLQLNHTTSAYITATLLKTTTFTITCSGPSGSVSDSVTITVTGTPPPVVHGDVDQNGKINSTDALLVSRYIAGVQTFTDDQMIAADVNNDGQITVEDSCIITNYSMGNIPSLPYGSYVACQPSPNGGAATRSLSASALSAFGSFESSNNTSVDAAASVAVNNQTTQAVPVASTASATCGTFTGTLMKGMVNAEVKCLQKLLGEKGFKVRGIEPGNETTYFGVDTETAVKSFQTSAGLKADGIFGPASKEALKSI